MNDTKMNNCDKIGVGIVLLFIVIGFISFCSAVSDNVYRKREDKQIDKFIDDCDNFNDIQKILLKRKHRSREDSTIFKSPTLNIHDFACTDLQKETQND